MLTLSIPSYEMDSDKLKLVDIGLWQSYSQQSWEILSQDIIVIKVCLGEYKREHQEGLMIVIYNFE